MPTINFELSDQEQDLKRLARDFAEKEIIPVASKYDLEGSMPWSVIEKAFVVGLWNLNVPEEYGGAGLSHFAEALVAEQLAYGCLGIFGAFGGNSLALTPLLIAGTKEQKEAFLPRFCSSLQLAAFALTEPNAGSDVSAISTRAEKTDDGYILNGTKCFITHGGIANLYTVFATIDRSLGTRGLTAFLVPGDAPGLRSGKKEDKMGDRASHIGEVIFEDVKIPRENCLDTEGNGFKIAMRTLDITRPIIGAAAVGVAQRAFDEAVKYARQRVQFGKPIGQHQAIQFMLADMDMAIEAARTLVWRAAWQVDQGKPNSRLSAMAKCLASDTAMKVTVDAVQVFGGYGYMREYPVEKLMRDAKITQIYEGTNQVQRMVIAGTLFR